MSKFENNKICALFCLSVLLFLIQIAVSPNAVRADDDKIHLKNGGFVTGQIMEVIPEQYATIRLADETVRKIEWAEIEKVETAPKPAPEPTPAQPPPPQPQAVKPSAPAPIAPLPTIQYEERTTTGIPGLYVPGFIILGVSWALTVAIGPSISKSEADEPDYDDEDSRYDDDDSSDPEDIDLVASFIPVIGPWVGLASDDSRVPKQLWVLSGAAQGIGAAMAIAGLSLSRTRRVPVYKTTKSSGIKAAYLSPGVMGYGIAGLSFGLVHY